jgi:hypothetical protein
MAFTYCEDCRRFYNDRRAHDCPASTEVVKKKPARPWTWRRAWHSETAADRAIARKFKNVKTAALF